MYEDNLRETPPTKAHDAALKTEMRRVKHIHFIGVGGVGMSGIAEVLYHEGFRVSGSDLTASLATDRLANVGIKMSIGHAAENIDGADVVVVSSAIDETNVEIIAARKAGVTLVPRAEMLAELMRFRQGVAVAGTHGKTTTTSLIATIFGAAGLDPTYVIGGQLASANANAKLGQGRYFVAEADESDASFLHLQPMVSVITNIDADHMTTYDGDFSKLENTFVDFVHNLPFYGLLVVCADDDNTIKLLDRFHRSYVTYGFSRDADYRLEEFESKATSSSFKVYLPGMANPTHVDLAIPGRHNALNATAALAVANEEGVDVGVALTALSRFAGVGRRFELSEIVAANNKQIQFVDDYGHHPKEVEVTVAACRDCWAERRLVMVFQPHRYSRTSELYDDFVSVLNEVDVLIILDVYSAGEALIPGADSRSLARSIRQRGRLDPIYIDSADLVDAVDSVLMDEDVLLFQGAGNIGKLAKHIRESLSVHGES